MSTQQQPSVTAADEGGLTKDEQEEVKALQEERKQAGQGKGVFSDSRRTRLSELVKKDNDAKEAKKAAKAEAKEAKK